VSWGRVRVALGIMGMIIISVAVIVVYVHFIYIAKPPPYTG